MLEFWYIKDNYNIYWDSLNGLPVSVHNESGSTEVIQWVAEPPLTEEETAF